MIGVLIVEDDALVAEVHASYVERLDGFTVVGVAHRAVEALSILRTGAQFDVILTDIEMPEMNGFEFAEAIRADARLAPLPVIALSSLVSPAAIERGRQAGLYDYIAKFDRPGLIAALKEQIEERARAEANRRAA